MNNKKCTSCGFINFVSAQACKKCDAPLPEPGTSQSGFYPSPPYGANAGPAYPAPPFPQPGTSQSTVSQYPAYGTNAGLAYPPPLPLKQTSPVLKILVGVFAGFLVLSGVGFTLGMLRERSRVKWIEYHPENIDLTVMMPNEPTRLEPITTPLTRGSMTNHRFSSVVTGQGAAVFGFVDYVGIEFPNDEVKTRALEAELNSFLKHSNSTLITKKSITYSGMQGLEFEVRPLDNLSLRNSHSYGRLLLSETRLYFLTITAAEGSELLAGKDKFLNPLMSNTAGFRAGLDLIPPSGSSRFARLAIEFESAPDADLNGYIKALIHPPSTGIEVPVI
ncbi:MAG TPA: zinc finger Ran-binding domain-containing protein [Pyrinomonadaceae bacterium]|nr:zinc finger Ran-binding domain-containing protein [Pyrinomonadaceae bacterium]